MTERRKIRAGIRATRYCRAQTTRVLEYLQGQHPDVDFEIQEIGGGDDGVLTALGTGLCDLHIRGARELPGELPDDLEIAACTQRDDPFDVLIAQEGHLLEDLPAGSVVAVDSSRVKVQLESFREDVELQQVDDTADRTFERLNAGEIAAFVVAAEVVQTFGWQESVSEVFPPDIVLPAAGQGSIALLVRKGDETSLDVIRSVDDLVTRQVVLAERAFLAELNVRPTDPVAVHGSFEDDTLVLEAMLGDEVSGAILRDDLDGEPQEEGDLGVRLAKLFMADGARDYLASYK